MNSRVNIPFSTNYKPFGVTKQQTTAFVHQKFIKLKDGEIKGTPVTVTAFMSATFVQHKTHGNTQSHTLHESETTDV